MIKELNEHVIKGICYIIPISQVPSNIKILDTSWPMKRKREVINIKVYKWKDRLNLYGGQREKGMNYNDTYSPVVGQFSIILLLVVSLLNDWTKRHIYFFLAFPQAIIECDLHMKFPTGTVLTEGNLETCVLLLHNNFYGQRKAGSVWNTYLHKGFTNIGFTNPKWTNIYI